MNIEQTSLLDRLQNNNAIAESRENGISFIEKYKLKLDSNNQLSPFGEYGSFTGRSR